MISRNELKWIRDGASIDVPNAPTLVKMEVETQPVSGSEEVQPTSESPYVTIKV